MISLPAGTRIWLAAGVTDMRRGMDGLAALVQSALAENPFSGHVFSPRTGVNTAPAKDFTKPSLAGAAGPFGRPSPME